MLDCSYQSFRDKQEQSGGRIRTWRKDGFFADLGAMVVTGLGASQHEPVTALGCQQLSDGVSWRQLLPVPSSPDVASLGGNPVSILARQIDLPMAPLRSRCPIYDRSGTLVRAVHVSHQAVAHLFGASDLQKDRRVC